MCTESHTKAPRSAIVLKIAILIRFCVRGRAKLAIVCSLPRNLLRNVFRNNIDEDLTVVRKTERDKETYKIVCFLA